MKALLTKQKTINKVILIPEYKIKPSPYQPRKVFDDEKIDQLATSIAQYGLLQPIPSCQPRAETISWLQESAACWPAAS